MRAAAPSRDTGPSARLATKLDHDNVVRTFQHGVHQGMHYLVMEFLAGETLEETLQRRQRLPLEEALAIMIQALEGLDHLHEVGLSKYDMPEFFMRMDAFPLTASGKILKRELVEWTKAGKLAPVPVRWTAKGKDEG